MFFWKAPLILFYHIPILNLNIFNFYDRIPSYSARETDFPLHAKEKMHMDIISRLSTTMSTINTNHKVGVAMLKNSMEVMETAGDMMTKMIETAPAPALNPEGVGANIDIRI